MGRGGARADDSECIAPFDVNHHQQPEFEGNADHQEAELGDRMVRVVVDPGERVEEFGRRLLEGHGVLPDVLGGLFLGPREDEPAEPMDNHDPSLPRWLERYKGRTSKDAPRATPNKGSRRNHAEVSRAEFRGSLEATLTQRRPSPRDHSVRRRGLEPPPYY